MYLPLDQVAALHTSGCGKGDQQISTLDLYDTRFVLLSGPVGQLRTGRKEVSKLLGAPIDCYLVAPEGPLADKTGQFQKLHGIGPEGAILVRPDGHVAWRTQASAAKGDLERALHSILNPSDPTPVSVPS